VTVAQWRDLWLHEGFACYAEWLWSEASGGPVADVLAATTWQRLAACRRTSSSATPARS
jgi:aminopeptidase